jgi:hypothetical protein
VRWTTVDAGSVVVVVGPGEPDAPDAPVTPDVLGTVVVGPVEPDVPAGIVVVGPVTPMTPVEPLGPFVAADILTPTDGERALGTVAGDAVGVIVL